MCGAGTYPGGMILGGGYIGANVLAEDFGVQKTWEAPDVVKKARERGIFRIEINRDPVPMPYPLVPFRGHGLLTIKQFSLAIGIDIAPRL